MLWRSAPTDRPSQPAVDREDAGRHRRLSVRSRIRRVVQRIRGDLPNAVNFLKFSPDGRFLAATLGPNGAARLRSGQGLERGVPGRRYGAKLWRRVRARRPSGDNVLRRENSSLRVRPERQTPTFAPSASRSRRQAEAVRGACVQPDGNSLAVGYDDVAAVDLLDARTLKPLGGQSPVDATPSPDGLETVAWSRDGRTLYAAGAVIDAQVDFSSSPGIAAASAANGA